MQVTRRFWTVVASGLVLACGAVVFRRPVLLAGGAAIGAWLLVHQVLFLRHVTHLDTALAVDQSLAPDRVATDDPVTVTLAAHLDVASPLAVVLTARPPAPLTGSTERERRLHVEPGAAAAETTIELQAPVAGAFTFDTPTVTVADAVGLFREHLERGPTPTVHVEPRRPRDLHVGEGGNRIAVAYGRHETGRLGSGHEPAELREYVPGDAANRVDWKATARLNQLFVREFEAETDRTTVLLVDHRSAMTRGRAGETELDYAREAALTLLDYAHDLDDPVGLYTVGDAGLTSGAAPEASQRQYRQLRTQLETLRPTDDPSTGAANGSAAGAPSVAAAVASARTPAEARRAAQHLRQDDEAFASTLRPYFAATDRYVRRIEEDPLFSVTQLYLTRLPGSQFTVVFTDDTNRAELREAVKLARRGDDGVAVFLTPSVLFEPGALADLDAAYDRYLEFEEFRRSLARMERVAAYEVGPGDRLGELLGARRRQRARAEPEVVSR